jgi:hypothetical protein
VRSPKAFSLACLALALLAAQASADIQSSLPAGTYGQSQSVFFSTAVPKATLFYRYGKDGAFYRFRSNLALEALPGEDCVYEVSVSERLGPDELSSKTFRFEIDREAPLPPLVSTSQSDAATMIARPGASVTLTVPRAKGDERVFYSLVPGQPETAEYVSGVTLPGIDGQAIHYELTAYSMDAAGNLSAPRSYSYVVVSEGMAPPLQISPNAAKAAAPAPSAALSVAVGEGLGFKALRFSCADAASFEWRVRSDSPDSDSPWNALSATDSQAQLNLRRPEGWTGTLFLEARAVKGGQPISAPALTKISFLAPAPEKGSFVPDIRFVQLPDPDARATARGAWLFADSNQARYEYQVNSRPSAVYSQATFISAKADETSLALRYRAYPYDGGPMVSGDLLVEVPRAVGTPSVGGIPAKGVTNAGVSLYSGDARVLMRYEISSDGREPSPVKSTSPLFPQKLDLDVAAGETKTFTIRARSFLDDSPDAIAGDEIERAFTLDKIPPEAPRLREIFDRGAAPNKYVSLDSQDGTVFYSITKNSQTADSYSIYSGPILLEADPKAPVNYLITAYALDAAGNKSAVVSSKPIMIDALSVYVAQSGSDQNDGSPSAPLGSLEAALRLASLTERKVIKLCGAVKSAGDIVLDSDISVLGDYDATWAMDPASRASLELRSLSVKRGAAVISSVNLSVSRSRSVPVSVSAQASLRLEDLSCSISGDRDVGFDLGRDSRFNVIDSEVSVTSASLRLVAVSSAGAGLAFTRSRISSDCPGVGLGLYCAGGSLTLDESYVGTRASQSALGLRLEETGYRIHKGLIQTSSAGGFVTALTARRSSGGIDTSLIRVSDCRDSVVFDLDGGDCALSHVSALVEGKVRNVSAFRAQDVGLDARNSVVAILGQVDKGVFLDGWLDPKAFMSFYAAGFSALAKDPASADAVSQRVKTISNKGLYEFDAKGSPRILPDSPLVDQGLAPESQDGTDFYGNPRPSNRGKRVSDVGALEY